MTVKKLIDELTKHNPDAVIKAEGCQQCVHPITKVITYDDDEVWLEIDIRKS